MVGNDGLLASTHRFSFDRVYSTDATQLHIYEESAKPAVHAVLSGYNASIIAYGQTGAGKTFTMEGHIMEQDNTATAGLFGEARGVVPRAIEDVFSVIAMGLGDEMPDTKYLVRASYLQIYNEVISDLLKSSAPNALPAGGLQIREDRRRGVYVEGLSEWVVRTPSEVYELMRRGAHARATGSTKLNESSSRSHAIFILIVERSTGGSGDGSSSERNQSIRVGKLNLVDLAGSERVAITGAKGQRLEESKRINSSLSALGNVIAALTDAKGLRTHVPYRDSKLTRILEDSLGGNCRTTFLACISPAAEAFSETLSTLKFAKRAKRVRNAPKINEDADHVTLLRRYEKELRKLRAELASKSKDLVDKRLVLEVEEARRREQADKIAAITALERQSAEIAKHKAAMAALQTRIANMQSQLLGGGRSVQDTPQFRSLLAAEQAKVRAEYEGRLKELEDERRTVASDRAQVERLKGLLIKQRDIMRALSQRLTERDGQILALQTEIEAADERQKGLEHKLDLKTSELIKLRKNVETRSGVQMCAEDWAIQAQPAAPPPGPEQVTSDMFEAGLSQSDSQDEALQGQLEQLQIENTTLTEERAALKTILGQKVAVLVDDALSALSKGNDPATLQKQLEFLSRLVWATTDAL